MESKKQCVKGYNILCNYERGQIKCGYIILCDYILRLRTVQEVLHSVQVCIVNSMKFIRIWWVQNPKANCVEASDQLLKAWQVFFNVFER